MENKKRAALFIVLGQSNAVGHGVYMYPWDKINWPLKNVFGLHRRSNQTFDNNELFWNGYTSDGMNLGETQDHTYSVPNCLASIWQRHIDEGNVAGLPDLYIVHIAIGGQGITEGYMWYPEREKRLVPGELGTVDISLYPFAMHIMSLIDGSFRNEGIEYDVIGVHWRGGENDVTKSKEYLSAELKSIYANMVDEIDRLFDSPPIVFHKIVCGEKMNELDPTGSYFSNMNYINCVFSELEKERKNVSVFDPCTAPWFDEKKRGGGLFVDDGIHYDAEVNKWIAELILEKAGT